jgi:hypothetical protein
VFHLSDPTDRQPAPGRLVRRQAEAQARGSLGEAAIGVKAKSIEQAGSVLGQPQRLEEEEEEAAPTVNGQAETLDPDDPDYNKAIELADTHAATLSAEDFLAREYANAVSQQGHNAPVAEREFYRKADKLYADLTANMTKRQAAIFDRRYRGKFA